MQRDVTTTEVALYLRQSFTPTATRWGVITCVNFKKPPTYRYPCVAKLRNISKALIQMLRACWPLMLLDLRFTFCYFIIFFRKSQENTPALEECSPDFPGEKNRTRQSAPPERGCGPCSCKTSLKNLKAVTERIQFTRYPGLYVCILFLVELTQGCINWRTKLCISYLYT